MDYPRKPLDIVRDLNRDHLAVGMNVAVQIILTNAIVANVSLMVQGINNSRAKQRRRSRGMLEKVTPCLCQGSSKQGTKRQILLFEGHLPLSFTSTILLLALQG